MHLRFQQRKTELWAPGRSSLSAGGRRAAETQKHTLETEHVQFILVKNWPVPLLRSRSRAQSRACRSSGMSSEARRGTGA